MGNELFGSTDLNITDPDNIISQTTSEYDDDGNLLSADTQLRDGSTLNTIYTYDEDGNILTSAADGDVATFNYDENGFLVSISRDDIVEITFVNDADGKPLMYLSETFNRNFTYYEDGQLKRESGTLSIPAISFSTSLNIFYAPVRPDLVDEFKYVRLERDSGSNGIIDEVKIRDYADDARLLLEKSGPLGQLPITDYEEMTVNDVECPGALEPGAPVEEKPWFFTIWGIGPILEWITNFFVDFVGFFI